MMCDIELMRDGKRMRQTIEIEDGLPWKTIRTMAKQICCITKSQRVRVGRRD